MSISLNSYFVHPTLSVVIAILILSGVIQLGNIIQKVYFKQDGKIVSLGLGMVLVSQSLYIASLHPFTFLLLYPVATVLIVLGVVFVVEFGKQQVAIALDYRPASLLALLLSSAFVLASLGPPTSADALDYHLGIPIYLLRHQEWPPTSLWLHGSLGGIGEIFNTLGVALQAESLGAILQPVALIGFCHYLVRNQQFHQAVFLRLFILSSPVLIFMVTGPKPLLFPQVLTAIALHLTVSEKKIDKKTFLLICILVMGAAQQKLPFIFTGGVIGLWALWKALPQCKIALIYGLVGFAFFFVPRGLWNLQQVPDPGITAFFTPLPLPLLEAIGATRHNHWWVPVNLFIPESLGKITTVIGFQLLLVFFIRALNPRCREAMILILVCVTLTILIGRPIGRTAYEYVLWTAVAFSFLSENEFRFRFYNRFLIAQGIGVLALGLFAVYTLAPGFVSAKWKEETMHVSAHQYSAAEWLNRILPENAVILSELRSVAFLKNDFVPTDWLTYPPLYALSGDSFRKRYYEEIKNKNVNFVALIGGLSKKSPLFSCIGKRFAGPQTFLTSTRNPFNRGNDYTVSVYHFYSDRLPYCASD